MTTKKKVIITTTIVLVIAATGLVVASKMKKKEAVPDGGGSSSSNIISIPGQVYDGLTASQTRALQGRLNTFIQSGALGSVLGWLAGNAPTGYEFRTEASGKVYYRYMFEGKQRGWFLYQSASPDIAKQAYAAWVASGRPSAATAPGAVAKAVSSAPAAVAALATFRNTIQQNLTNGTLAVDGVYGKNTMAVVMALQIYLNAVKKAGLQIDGKYGKATDTASGWHILT